MDLADIIEQILAELKRPEARKAGHKLAAFVRMSREFSDESLEPPATDVAHRAVGRSLATVLLDRASIAIPFRHTPGEGLMVAVDGDTKCGVHFQVRGRPGQAMTGRVGSVEMPAELAVALFEDAQHALYKPWVFAEYEGKRPGRGELTRLRRAGADPTCSGHVGSREDPPFEPAAR